MANDNTAIVSNDRATIKELFSTPEMVWWDSPNDRNIRVLKITPDNRKMAM